MPQGWNNIWLHVGEMGRIWTKIKRKKIVLKTKQVKDVQAKTKLKEIAQAWDVIW